MQEEQLNIGSRFYSCNIIVEKAQRLAKSAGFVVATNPADLIIHKISKATNRVLARGGKLLLQGQMDDIRSGDLEARENNNDCYNIFYFILFYFSFI